jgi:hypothetical protein
MTRSHGSDSCISCSSTHPFYEKAMAGEGDRYNIGPLLVPELNAIHQYSM